MAIKCSIYEIDKVLNTYNDFLIVDLLPIETIKNKFKDFEIVSLGQALSLKLIQIDHNIRNAEVEKVTKSIFSEINSNKLIVTDIDILFNPLYKLDIIKLFMQLSTNKKVIVQWPGRLDSNNFVYSEPKYEDYKKYEIKNYNIICLR